MIVKILRTQLRDQNQSWNPKTFDRNRYPVVESESLLIKLNTIIEWDFVKWPKSLSQVEDENAQEYDTKYLGDSPELKPGDVFSIGEAGNLQVFRVVDDNTLGIVSTDTGGLSLRRFFDETLQPEINLLFNLNLSFDSVTSELVEINSIPETFTVSHRLPYGLYKVWSDKFFLGREQDWVKDGHCIKLEVNTELSFLPITCYIQRNEFKFDEDIDIELAKLLALDISSWFYNNFPRLMVKESNTIEEVLAKIKENQNP